MISYEAAIQNLESRTIMPKRAPSLETTRQAIADLGEMVHLTPGRTIVIAGTNGKGTVAATLEALLRHHDQSTGLYTSPHLIDTTERIRINGKDITREEFAKTFDSLAHTCPNWKGLSHFEAMTLMSAAAFKSAQVEWNILEVGLGGIWDSTNAFPHDFSVITRIGMDHTDLLGNNIAEITRNKLGIASGHLFYTEFPEEALWVAEEVKARDPSILWTESLPYAFIVEPSTQLDRDPRYFIHTPLGHFEMQLPGRRAAENTALALTVFQNLGLAIDPSKVRSALLDVRWPARMERVSQLKSKRVYLSGDHNPQGMASMLELLPYYPRKKVKFLVGIGIDKAAPEMLESLIQVPQSELFLTVTPFKGRSRADYGPWIKRAHGFFEDPKEGIKYLLNNSTTEDLILVTGSLYLAGAVRGMLANLAS